MKNRLIVVDISSFIFRSFFAIRPLHSPQGVPVNAVFGVMSMLIKLIEEWKPTHMIMARDPKGGSFRNEVYEEYKANRSEAPPDLIPQFALIEELMEKMQIPAVTIKGYEADDIIGCVVTQYRDEFKEIFIVSGDKDLMQFVDGKVKMLDTMKETVYGPEEVTEKMGVPPSQIVDYLSLIGDSSDNIPGVKGIGPKGAQKLLAEFETLENIYRDLDKIENKGLKEKLIASKKEAFLSKELVTIKCDLDLKKKIPDLEFELNPSPELLEFLLSLGFKNLEKKFEKFLKGNKVSVKAEVVKKTEIDGHAVTIKKEFSVTEFPKDDVVGVCLLTDNEDYHLGAPCLLAIHSASTSVVLTTPDEIKKAMRGLAGTIVSFASKPIYYHFPEVKNIFDLIQAHFVVNPSSKHETSYIIEEVTGDSLTTPENPFTNDLLGSREWEDYALQVARHSVSAYMYLQNELRQKELEKLFLEIDNPLQKVLATIERLGIKFDPQVYADLEKKFSKELDSISKLIEAAGGEGVNIKSPKQVGALLFDKLKLPVIRKTKTGYSTDSDTLEELDALGISEIPGNILKYRELEKLLSTYIKGIPKLIHSDGRMHTHFLQEVAETGRLSSENPNLQNIPIRTENGRMLRKGFIAEKGKILLSADYSQVELRILAHFSEDPTMVSSFLEDKDIHIQTASEIFEVPLDKVTKAQRSSAKAINFGLMYGQSSFGLSQTLKIPQKEAREYITNYFAKFNRVKAYLDTLKEFCEQTGYSITLMGRKRFLPDIKSSNRQIKSMAERMAINSPIQGTAADIIKLAMLNIMDELEKKKLKSKLLLQVHDELIFETDASEEKILAELVREKMENVVSLKVPLKVDMGTGQNWFDL